MNEITRRALILSGGGGRGAYHCGVLEYLELIGWRPDILVGTSIGAINAAAIASGHDSHSLQDLWRVLTTDRVQKLRVDLFDISTWTYLLDNSPWRQSLTTDWFDFARINADGAPTLAVTATDVYSGRLTVFCNRDLEPSKSGGPRSKLVRQVQFNLDHILASCSIPVIYPWTLIQENDGPYWDGAVVSNTPLGTALRAGATEIIVVLLSPWEEEDSAYVRGDERRLKLWSLPGLALDWALLASFRSDLKLCNAVNDFVAAFELLDETQREQLALKLWGDESPNERWQRLGKLSEWRSIEPPRIVAPKRLLPVEQIITYDLDAHERLFEMGRSDAARILRNADLSGASAAAKQGVTR
jgi:NTE family protein